MLSTLVPGAEAVRQPTNGAAPSHSVTTSQSASASKQGSLTSTVRGTFGRQGTVRGTFEPRRFVVKKGDTYAVGVLHATMRRANGDVVGRPSKTVSIPVKNAFTGAGKTSAARNCQVLDLVLGPLDLNLLGLKVHLNRIVLHIVATSGAGALLGNLICAIAGLLDGTSLLDRLRLANVLNRILGVLNI
jgi:hypothetical protein